MSRLVPEVAALIRDGKLPVHDGDWIKNLPAEMQMAAAEKCINGSLSSYGFYEDRPKTQLNTPLRGKTRSRR